MPDSRYNAERPHRPALFQNPGAAPMSTRLAVKSPRLVACILSAVACLLATGSNAEEPDKPEKSAADSMLGTEAGQVRDDNGLKMKLVWCPKGFVTMERVEVVAELAAKKDDEPNDDDDDPDVEPS